MIVKNSYVRRLSFLILVVFFAILNTSCSHNIKNILKESEENKYSCIYKGNKRTFYLYIPEVESYENTGLVVMLHGYGNSARSFMRTTQFEKTALPRNYGVLYVNGVPDPNVKMAEAGWDYSYTRHGKNDMDFILDLVKFVQNQYGLSKKTYVTGFSNGAFMVTKLASEKSDFFEAFVSVGGMMPEEVWNHKKEKKSSVKFMQINGTKDAVTPMKRNDSFKYNPNPAMEDVIEYFVKINEITSEPEVEEINKKIEAVRYENKVCWVIIDKYPHAWPTERYCELNINELILDFFEAE